MQVRSLPRLRVLCLLLVLHAAGGIPLAAQDKLTLPDVYAQLRERNPQLVAAHALVDATAQREPGARLPADPSVQLGVMNFSLPGFSANMPTSMAPSVQLMQMMPIPGKLTLAGAIAGRNTDVARAQANGVWWQLRARAAMSFYELYSVDRQLLVMNESLQLLEDFERVAKSMYGAGQGRQSDVLRANVETARMKADLARMRAMRSAAVARMNGVLNRAAETRIAEVRLAEIPGSVPGGDTLRAWAEAAQPMLARGHVLVEQSELLSALARRELWPDFTVGLAYGQRPATMGTERMGSVMLGFTVPVFAGQRQLRMRDEAAAMQRMAQAELQAMRADVHARIGELLATLERTATLLTLYRNDIVPQAEANVQSAFSAYRVGSVDFMTLVDGQMTLNRYRQEVFALIAEHGAAIAELEMNIGRELPSREPLFVGQS
ncbi:MAG: TolC family protein [Gemmatimonadota bacterium]